MVFMLPNSLLILALIQFSLFHTGFGRPTLQPIIIVPGIGGSQLEVRLNKPKTSDTSVLCQTKTDDYEVFWLNPLKAIQGECYVDDISLEYDNVTGKSTNPEGVLTRVPGFGNTTTIEQIDPSGLTPFGKYFAPLIDRLVSWGYKRGVSVRGAPYDFRKAPNEQHRYFRKLKRLVEETYAMNNGKRLILLGHSMGTTFTLYFLNLQSSAWKKTYIHSFISLGGVYGGSVKPVRVLASGYNNHFDLMSALTIRRAERTLPSLTYLFPRVPYWAVSDVLVETPAKNYSLANIEEFFKDLNYSVGYDMYLRTNHIMDDLGPPRVPVECVYGTGVDTEKQYIYGAGDFPDVQPQIVYGDGDGSVNIQSLEGCRQWVSQQSETVTEKTFPGVEHVQMLSDENFFSYLKTIL